MHQTQLRVKQKCAIWAFVRSGIAIHSKVFGENKLGFPSQEGSSCSVWHWGKQLWWIRTQGRSETDESCWSARYEQPGWWGSWHASLCIALRLTRLMSTSLKRQSMQKHCTKIYSNGTLAGPGRGGVGDAYASPGMNYTYQTINFGKKQIANLKRHYLERMAQQVSGTDKV